jgi:hypothetical protein
MRVKEGFASGNRDALAIRRLLAQDDLVFDHIQGAMPFDALPETTRACEIATVRDFDPGSGSIDLGPWKSIPIPSLIVHLSSPSPPRHWPMIPFFPKSKTDSPCLSKKGGKIKSGK